MLFLSRETSVLQMTFHVFQKNSNTINHPPVDELFVGGQQPGKGHKNKNACKTYEGIHS